VNKIIRNQRGQGMTEYIIIAILVALVVMFAVNRFGGMLRNRFGQAVQSVSSVGVTDKNVQNLQQDTQAQQTDSADAVAPNLGAAATGD
jgi:Flp pilus assembly pilin Flp